MYVYIYIYITNIYIYIYIYTFYQDGAADHRAAAPVARSGLLRQCHQPGLVTILYYTILYCTILYYTITYYTVLHYTQYYNKSLYPKSDIHTKFRDVDFFCSLKH